MIHKDIFYTLGGHYHNHIFYGNEPQVLTIPIISGSNNIFSVQLSNGANFNGGSIVLAGSGTGIQSIDIMEAQLQHYTPSSDLEDTIIKDFS